MCGSIEKKQVWKTFSTSLKIINELVGSLKKKNFLISAKNHLFLNRSICLLPYFNVVKSTLCWIFHVEEGKIETDLLTAGHLDCVDAVQIRVVFSREIGRLNQAVGSEVVSAANLKERTISCEIYSKMHRTKGGFDWVVRKLKFRIPFGLVENNCQHVALGSQHRRKFVAAES